MALFAIRLLLWVAGVYGFALPIIAVCWPIRYRKIVYAGINAPGPLILPVALITAFFPLGRVIYCASYAITFIIPPQVYVLGGDGDKTSLRFVAQLFIAVVGSVAAAGALDSLTERKVV